jgi:hypothetical protein
MVSRFYLYILELLMENLFEVEYYMTHVEEDKYMDECICDKYQAIKEDKYG